LTAVKVTDGHRQQCRSIQFRCLGPFLRYHYLNWEHTLQPMMLNSPLVSICLWSHFICNCSIWH